MKTFPNVLMYSVTGLGNIIYATIIQSLCPVIAKLNLTI